MKLCSRLLVLYCRNCPKDDKFRYLIPHFEEVRGCVKPCWWLVGKIAYDFLFVIIELFSLALTIDALQGKTCQNSLLFGGGGSVWAKILGGRGRPSGIFLVSRKLDTFCYLTMQTAPCYVQSFWHNTGVWRTDGRTDGQTDGIVVASTALAIRALRRAVKIIKID